MTLLIVGLMFSSTLTAILCATDVELINHWSGGFQGKVCIPITKELDGWKAHLMFDQDVKSLEVWTVDATKISNKEYILENKGYNAIEHKGEQLCLTFIGHGDGDITPKTTIYIEGMGDSGSGGTVSGSGGTGSGSGGTGTSTGSGDGSGNATTNKPHVTTHTTPQQTQPPSTGGGMAKKDYGMALGKSILFYDAQRSGKLPGNNPIPWRGDSAINDCVPGGWYDAGDHVKFGLPMASSTTLLLWSLNKFKNGYEKAGQLDEMYDMIYWPLDFFLRAWDPTKKDLVVQVGDGNKDHTFWGRPEDMTMDRPCLHVNQGTKGSDIAAETAAALAAGYLVFKEKGDNQYATRLLTAAESLYAFAKSNRGVFGGAAQFYGSSNDQDEMCEASAWLYKATNNNNYLNDAKQFVETAWGWALSWDDKKVACQALVYEETQNAAYKAAVVGFFDGWLPGGQVTYTPCGLAWRDKWGANRYAGNAAFMALVAAEMGINTKQYRTWAVEQINYLLGDNKHDGGCFSYEIGYGNKFPKNPHHRGASCPDRPAPCNEGNLNSGNPSPQILQGALVGGPDSSDNYRDVRTDYVQNEVATDYNSGFHGALAAIEHLVATNNLPVTHNKCPCN